MNSKARQHVKNAKTYLKKGEDFYRSAAREMKRALDAGATTREVGVAVGQSAAWVTKIVQWGTSVQSTKQLPFSEQSGAVAQRHARSVLRNADPEQIADLLNEPAVRRKVEKAQEIAHDKELRQMRGSTSGATLTDRDYDTARDSFDAIRERGSLEMRELFTALSAVRVRGIEKIVGSATAKDRREWAERLPEEIALLQFALDLCKTRKLEAVGGKAS